MVKKSTHTETPESWLAHFTQLRPGQDASQLKSVLALISDKDPVLLKQGIGIADILLALQLDNETLAAALIFPFFQNHEIHQDVIADHFGDSVRKLLNNTLQMRALDKFQTKIQNHHLENLRKMLLAMVTDIRAVIIILAEKLIELRQAKTLDPKEQKQLAKKILSIYSPLANRLGIWQLKWEMEDLSLRYLEPDTYKQIAKSLESKRIEREAYIINTKKILSSMLSEQQIKKSDVTGRVKHIYSIYAKMKRKNADFNKIYDISAFRILVPEIPDCYEVLSMLQHTWQPIPEEFDDYIAQPKANGYQSIHTVVTGPENRVIEIQIRTYQMHQESEIGVASHWQYKEKVATAPRYEEKIALLRQIIAWENEIIGEENKKADTPIEDLFADRVYVFTPVGDIIDLPKGATPIDFAYHIHGEVGHRCRGAKVDGKMVTLTYQLQTGQRVEILTAKQAHPSLDWLNPHLGYIKTVKARSHIQHWFRMQDESAEKEEAVKASVKKVIKRKVEKKSAELANIAAHPANVQNFLTNVAGCCKPTIGDAVIGYITRKNAISIHKINCRNISNLKMRGQQRFIDVAGKKR